MMENAGCGVRGQWKMRGRWKMRGVENAGSVENAGCGKCGVGGKCGVHLWKKESYTNEAHVCLKIAHS